MFRKNADPICLSKLLKDFSVDNVKKTALYRYVYDSPLDYDSIDVDDFVNIHKHLIKSTIQNLVSIYYKKLYWVIKRFYNQNVALASNSEGHTKFVSLNNWPYQAIPRLVDINSNDFFIHLLPVLINAAEDVIMIYMLEYVFQIKQNTWM